MDDPQPDWAPIVDLSDRDKEAASAELPPLAEVWREQRAQLQADSALREFNSRLQREWAVETGILERLYTLDRGTTALLIERGIDAALIAHDASDQDPVVVAAMITDQAEAVDWLFDFVKQQRKLTTSFIKELHSLITSNQASAHAVNYLGQAVEVALRKGEYKELPNNPTRPDRTVHWYAPPEQVANEMERLVELSNKHQADAVAPEISAAWLHHRFTQIHPFQDGNGRIARAIASLVFLRAGWFPLVVTRDDRDRYIGALEDADAGDLTTLISLFSAIQKRAFIGALGIAREVRRDEERVDQVIDAITDLFQKRDATLDLQFDEAKQLAARAYVVAGERFDEVQGQIDAAIHHAGRPRRAFHDQATPDDPDRRQWHRWQVVESAQHLGYFANMADYSSWQRLGLVTESGRAEVLLSFHVIGREYRGVIGASLSFYRKPADEDERQVVEHETVCDDVFQINYKESVESVESRFRTWLDQGLVRGLEVWRRGE